jgi:hypothetical protein
MLLCSSRVLALRIVRAPIVAAAIMGFAPAAAAQQGPAPATGTAAPKKDAPKKDAPKKAEPAPATPAATPAPAATPEPAATDESAAKPAVEEKEDKRAIYISVDLGFTRADVGGISDNTGFDKTGANGLVAGLGLGYRFKQLRLGARFRDASTTEYSLWSLMGEVGYGLPFRPVSPTLYAHAGYMFDSGIERAVISSSLPPGNVLTPNVDLDGFVVGGEIVASLWLTKFLRVGPFVGVDFMWLHRAQAALPQSIVPLGPETRNNALFNDSGSGVGYLLNIGLRGTGDIGF